MQKTKIEWSDATWNAIRGCDEVTPGCDNCYARKIAERYRGVPGSAYEQGFDLRLVPHKLDEPLHKLSQLRIFVNSMSDLFHKKIPKEYIIDIAKVMNIAQWHTFQVLTKRSSRMRTLLNGSMQDAAMLPNVWWGVSVEDKKHGLPRIKHLQEITEAKVRWLSIEPLLEDLGKLDLRGIHGVVVGGESGPGFREMQQDWVVSILHQCEDHNIPFFFKQWGGVIKKKTGRKLGNKEYNEQPQTSNVPIIPWKDRMRAIAAIQERTQHWLDRKDLGNLVFRNGNSDINESTEIKQLGTERITSSIS